MKQSSKKRKPTCVVLRLGRLDYDKAWELQKELAAARRQNAVPDILVLLEHEPIYTIGKTGSEQNLLVSSAFLQMQNVAVKHVDRGGDITFHGPGQLVGYPILNLETYKADVVWYVRQLENVLIQTLAAFGVQAEQNPGFTGVWIGDEKIAAIGVKVSRWITWHGFALNISTDLKYFDWIVPCGIRNKAVCNLVQYLDERVTIRQVEPVLIDRFGKVFGTRMMPFNHDSWPAINAILKSVIGQGVLEII